MHVKKDQEVIVLTGKDKGKSGKVIKAFPKLNKIIVEGVNVVKRHQRSKKKDSKGQIVEKTLPINVSNVAPKAK
ncbi:MAG: 50S ribosomal protein L24 [Candidatus Taylorbacteria bacterium]|nr:50S ribosomal protein L24 [Candidatus Taylorbacteria bacterium]